MIIVFVVIGLSEVSSSPADKAAQHHTVALFGQNPEDRNATAAGSTASSPPGSDPAPVATPGAPQGTSPAERIGPALGPRSGLGAMPLQTSSTSQKSHSSSVSVKTQGAAVMDGAEGDMYAVSDALLLDNISAAAAASQGSAGRKQSGCASRQTEAASSSSITPSTKGSQVLHFQARLQTFGFGLVVVGVANVRMKLTHNHRTFCI